MKLFFIAIIFILGVLSGHFLINERPIENVVMPIVAVSAENGTLSTATFSLTNGEGRVLFDSDPAIDTDMQNSIIISTAYAKEYSNNMFNDKDIIIDFNTSNEVIGGVSAGAAITVGTIAVLEGKKINKSIVLTGAISPDGNIRRVGEIREKAIAARNAGYTLFLVPPGQSRFRNQNYTLQELLNNTIEIREVATIDDAMKIMTLK
ncbi:MAG: S16 family serine protease [Candidatus Woesearchaeota archaeon]